MDSVNYIEKIVVPTLQKKIQDLYNSNLVLEVSLLVEQEKAKDTAEKHSLRESSLQSVQEQLNGEVTRATAFAHEASRLGTEVNSMSARITTLEKDLRREMSVKESILSEYRALKDEHESLKKKYSNAIAEIEQIKQSITEQTKKKAKQ